jgi:replication-associated recombination protein RarA
MNLVIHDKTAAQLDKLATKPPHALLIVAPEGAGKRAVAIALIAQLLNTTEAKLVNTAELLTVTPDKDEAFGIDSVRTAQHFMTRKISQSESRVVQRIAFLPDAHNMTREAQNALLKLLEEPPAGSMLILTATSEQAMLPTIISRCQVLKLQKPTNEQLTQALTAVGYDGSAIELAVRISDGWPSLALAMLDPKAEHPFATATEQARGLLQQTTFERLSSVDALAKKRELCNDLCYILQQMAHIALQTASEKTLDRWQRVLTASYACQQALGARVNAKLAMTQLMLSL